MFRFVSMELSYNRSVDRHINISTVADANMVRNCFAGDGYSLSMFLYLKCLIRKGTDMKY